jgi:hemoglobin
MSDESLYQRLGGAQMIEKAVDAFYQKVLADDRVRRFFDDIDMDQQRARQREFLTYSLGGPATYTGKELRVAHQRLVDAGLSDIHFVIVCEHLVSTLNELGAPPDAVVGVLTFLESKRDDVLCR